MKHRLCWYHTLEIQSREFLKEIMGRFKGLKPYALSNGGLFILEYKEVIPLSL